MKKFSTGFRISLLVLLLLLGVTGCGERKSNGEPVKSSTEAEESKSEETKTVRISVAAASKINMPDSISCEDGSILEILKYPDGILGSDQDMLRGCQAGTISVYIGDINASADMVPELALFSIPYLIEDLKEYQDKMESSWQDWFQPYYQKAGMQLLAWKANHEGCLVSTVPVKTLEDLQNVNLRIKKNPYRERYWLEMGVNLFPVTFDELGYYLQTGQVNVVDAGMRALIYSGYIEYFHYVILLKHIPFLLAVVVNQEEYEKLTPAQQRALKEYAAKAINYEDTVRQCIEMYDMEVMEPDETLDARLRAGKQGTIEALKKSLGEDLVNDFLNTVENKDPEE